MILHGDARSIPLPDKSVQCVVTSPPYWGLRNYNVEGQIGLEKTPDEYVQTLVQVFRELRRVLRDDGTVWLNLGDGYATGTSAPRNPTTISGPEVPASWAGRSQPERCGTPSGLKTKDLIGIPWRVALALQADGWYLRSDIIWAKPNPMPESVTDRPTRSHEYVFLLTKRERYYYDHEAVKENLQPSSVARVNQKSFASQTGGEKDYAKTGQNVSRSMRKTLENFATSSGGRNARSVWTITPKPFKGAHFATFPPELPERCIKAGTPEGGSCASCGSPRKRIIEKGAPLRDQQIACGSDVDGIYTGTATKDFASGQAQDASATKARILAGLVERRTLGWVPTCKCSLAKYSPPRRRSAWHLVDWQDRVNRRAGEPVPAVVFDPFSGSGTTVMVAERLGRVGHGLDLNPAYNAMAEARRTNTTHTHTPVSDKQSGHSRRHAGFNARWRARHAEV